MGMALIAFIPCVILPEWQQLQALHVAEQYEQYRADRLQKSVDSEKRLLMAMSSDPAVVARLAQRDLSLHRRDERAILVSVANPTLDAEEVFAPAPLPPPAPIGVALAHLPPYDYIDLFCNNRTRIPILALSASLLTVSFALFGRRTG